MPAKKRENGLTVPKTETKKNWHCISCNRDFVRESFYLSNSILTRGNDNRMPICKKCVEDLYNILVDKYNGECKTALYRICQMLDIYYDALLYTSVEKQATESSSNICKIYLQKINSLPQYRNKVFSDSTSFEDIRVANDNTFVNHEYTEDDKKNKNDVINLLGFDPFSNENDKDKKFLYNTLNGYLDEETLQDGFKISAIIEIVKSFNQLESINRSIAQITANEDVNSLSHTQLKTLIDSKANLTRQINSFAKDNGISTMHSNNKSKGANTLSGILKELRDKNVRESDVNLFDIRTCEAFRQLADVSNKSITSQLQFDDNDYADMINQQRVMIQGLQAELDKAKEEKRKLAIELKEKEKSSEDAD